MTPTESLFSSSANILIFSIIAVFLIVLCILWILLPFAVFGVRTRLDKIIAQNEAQKFDQLNIARQTNDNLKAILTEAQRTNAILAAVHNVEGG